MTWELGLVYWHEFTEEQMQQSAGGVHGQVLVPGGGLDREQENPPAQKQQLQGNRECSESAIETKNENT